MKTEGTHPEDKSWTMAALAVGLAILVTLATRLPYISEPALWIDEAFSAFYSAKGPAAIWGRDWHLDPTPPLYYCLLASWRYLFGMSEAAMRGLSVMLTCVTAANVLFIGLVFGSWRGGLLSALIWLLMPLGMEYSVEIRAYPLLQVILSGMLLAAMALLRRFERKPESLRALWACGLSVTLLSLLAFYTHVTSLFAVFGVSLALLRHFVRQADARGIRMWLVLSALFLAGAAPQAWASYNVLTANHATLAWLPASTLSWLVWNGRSLFLGEITVGALAKAAILAGWLLLLANGLWRLGRDAAAMTLLVVAPLLGLMLLVIFNFYVPILLPRTAMWVCLPIALLAGLGLARTPIKIVIPVTAVLAAGLLTIAQWNMNLRSEWRADHRNLEAIAARDAQSHIVTVDGERACVMAFYGLFEGRVRLLDLGSEQQFERTQKVDLGCNTPPPIRVDGLRAQLASGAPVWIIGSTDPSEDRRSEVVKLSRMLAGEASLSESIDVTGFYAARFQPVR